MKARSKFQIALVKLDKKLPKVTKKQKLWAFKHCFEHQACRLKSGKITCLDCSHSWQSKMEIGWHDEVLGGQCPKCGVKVKIKHTQKKVFHQSAYFTIITTFKGFQVIRHFDLNGYYKAGTKPKLWCSEISRIYITPEGKYGIIGYYCQKSWFGDRWCGDFCLRNNNTIGSHNINAYKIYPIRKTLKIIRRNGFKYSFYRIPPFSLFSALLINTKAETLIKTKQFDLLKKASSYDFTNKIDKQWQSIKIATKNNYIIKDAQMWFDLLNLQEHFGRDLFNPKYICPKNLKAEHNRLVKRKKDIFYKQKIKEMKAKLIKSQKIYKKQKQGFFKLKFVDNNIIVTPIKTVRQMLKESDYLEHCAFVSGYHNMPGSLMMSAKVNKILVETIEVSLRTFEVVQARGYDNEPSEYNPQIVALIEKNMPKIRKAFRIAT